MTSHVKKLIADRKFESKISGLCFQPLVCDLKADGHLRRPTSLRIPTLGRQLRPRLRLHQWPLPLRGPLALHDIQAVRILLQSERPDFRHCRKSVHSPCFVRHAVGRLLCCARPRVRGLQVL